MLAFTDCDYCYMLVLLSVVSVIIAICDIPRQEFSLCERVYIHTMYGICNFSNFVALCTDDTDTPVSCDKRFRDFWGYALISRQSHLMFIL